MKLYCWKKTLLFAKTLDDFNDWFTLNLKVTLTGKCVLLILFIYFCRTNNVYETGGDRYEE